MTAQRSYEDNQVPLPTPISYGSETTLDTGQIITLADLPSGVISLMCDLYDPDFTPDPARGYLQHKRAAPESILSHVVDRYGMEGAGVNTRKFIGALVCDAYIEGVLTEEQIDTNDRFDHDVRVIAHESILTAYQLADKLASDYVARVPDSVAPEKKLVAAAEIMAIDAYRGKKRKSGRNYSEHPREVAAMTHHVFSQLREQDYKIDDTFVNVILALDFLHDAIEETIKTSKYYRPQHEASISPLVVRLVMQKTGAGRYAYDSARALRLVTHETTTDWMPGYSDYIIRGAPHPLFDLLKLFDIKHNVKREPKFSDEQLQQSDKPANEEDADAFLLESLKKDKWRSRLQLYISSSSYIGRRLSKAQVYGHDYGNSRWGDDLVRLLNALPTDPASVDNMKKAMNRDVYGSDISPFMALEAA